MMKKYFSFLLVALMLAATLALSACSTNDEEKTFTEGEKITPEEATEIAENFINEHLMMDETQVSASYEGVAYDMYHLKINMDQQMPVDSFITKDGKLFFPQHLDIDEISGNEPVATDNEEQMADVEVPKSSEPTVEMFVMTYCPYGTQIQKGILPVLEVIGDDIEFKQMYVDYAMQDKKELDENLLQYCIQEQSTDELVAYLECFLAEEDQSDNCFNQVVSNPETVRTCVEETDEEFDVTKNFEEEIDWRGNFPGFNVHQEEVSMYGVGGAPTLIINGVEVPADRDAASLLYSICNAFEEKPEGCDAELPDTPPSPGFGFETSGANTVAACG